MTPHSRTPARDRRPCVRQRKRTRHPRDEGTTPDARPPALTPSITGTLGTCAARSGTARGTAKMSSMTVTRSPWVHPHPEESQIHLGILPEGVIDALAVGESGSPVLRHVSPYIAGPECVGLWRRRSTQLKETPSDAAWITRLIIDPNVALPVGLAGLHAAPDAAGMVEVGYRIDYEFRRRGYARRALEILLFVAHQHPDVKTVRATISPDNAASLALIGSYPFVENGEQWDDEDGREIIFETPS